MTTHEIRNVRGYLEVTSSFNDRLAKWLLENGWQMPLAHWLADYRMELGHCYSNGMEYANEQGYDYCEGYAATTTLGLPLMHGWTLADDGAGGAVVDPTWEDGADYFGVIIPRELAITTVLKNDVYGILPNLWMMDREDAEAFLAEVAEVNRDFREAVAA